MLNRGSEWRRWEPHIHAPGTILNNQFGGADPWGNYLTVLEGLVPKIEAIGVTDYYVTDTYEEVVRQQGSSSLPDVKLVFPNIEIRLDVAAKSGFVNVHLLVSPEDPDHLAELRRILTRLQFHAYDDRFDCTRSELIRLGRRANPTIKNDRTALAHGATQFKVNFDQLRKVYGESNWAKKNILIAVAGSETDGTSGVREGADATLRQEIEKFSHIIFASGQAQREFWLGQRSATADELLLRYNGCKPCLHGSDAHTQGSTGRPTNDRFSWIKGALTFDALRQACIDPAGRAYVGTEPPQHALPSQVISQVEITKASWASTPMIPLNPGLVAIIGARGSGKTALADVIAAGCDAIVDLILMYAGDPATAPDALKLAEQEIQARQDIWTLDAYAWALYANARYQDANATMQRAIASAFKARRSSTTQAISRRNSTSLQMQPGISSFPFKPILSLATPQMLERPQCRCGPTRCRKSR